MKNSYMKLWNFLGITNRKEMTFENILKYKTKFQNNEVDSIFN